MIIQLIQKKVPIASKIRIILKTGQEITGVLSEIGEFYVTLHSDSGDAVLTEELIGAWQLETDNERPMRNKDKPNSLPAPPTTSPTNSVIAASATPKNKNEEINQNDQKETVGSKTHSLEKRRAEQIGHTSNIIVGNDGKTPAVHPADLDIPTVYPAEVIRYETNLLLRFKNAVENIKLKPLPPNFTDFLDQEKAAFSRIQLNQLRQESNRFQNQYEYAIKIRDFDRLAKTIAGYEAFLKMHPNFFRGWFNLGCLCMKVNRLDDAIKAFELGSAYSSTFEILHNLAVAYLEKNDAAGALGALQRLFQQTSPSNTLDVWYQFLNLVLQFQKAEMLFDLLRNALEHRHDLDVRLVLDSTAFILSSYGWHDEARALIMLLLQESANSRKLLELYSSIIERLQIAGPTLLYQRQQQSLAEVNTRWQQAQQTAKQQEEILALLATAEQLAYQGKQTQAIAAVNKVLTLDPEHSEAKRRKAQYAGATKPTVVKVADKAKVSKPSTAPPSKGLHAQAKQAHIEKDFAKAERLFQLAIEQKDNAESAVKDLASLLQQQGRVGEAVSLLENYLEFATDPLRILNLLASIYQHANAYDSAIGVLEKILKMTPHDSRAKVMKQIGYCQVKQQQFDRAEETLLEVLKLNPQEATVKKWLDGLRQAKQTGAYASLDETIIVPDLLIDLNPSLSKFLEFYLERCEYQGVAEAKIASRSFSEDDLRKLRGLIEGAGKRRPRVRAQYNLSAGRLLMDLDTENERRFRHYMLDYSADMANASLAEQKHFDVALAYFTEAFAIAPQWHWKLRESLAQVIMLHYAAREDILDDKLPMPEESLNEALKRPAVSMAVIESLLELSLVNYGVVQYLLPPIMRDTPLRVKVQARCCELIGLQQELHSDSAKFAELWERGREHMRRHHQEIMDELVYLQSLAPALDSVQTQINRVKTLEQKLKRAIDRQRLKTIAEILGHMYDYVQQQSYVERERLVTIIKKRIEELIAEIEDSPTKYSLEMYRVYLLTLEKSMEEHFAKVQQAAEPELLECTLSIDSYIPDPELTIECQITVTNPPGKSPASALVIRIQDSPTGDFIAIQKSIPVSEALPGGKSITCTIPLVVTEKAKSSQVFTLYYQLSYMTRTGRKVEMENLTLPVRLYPDTEFVEIKNPYATYAEGGTVKHESMFYGRDQMIQNLVAAIYHAPTNKSLVIYGQKRTGKSSVLYHLKQRLVKQAVQPPIIPVDFSVGDIVNNISVTTFLYRILQRIEAALDDLADQGYPAVAVERPTLAQLSENPELIFHEYMTKFHKMLARFPEYKGARILLLIDEFSYVYSEIVRGKIPDTFMKSWKALLEKGYFGSVLVGQDIMRQFIERFPNEFQVAQSQRVSNLTPDDARKLMVDPIRIAETSESRYRGVALDRLLALTAGNPFYIQIFCARLVNYMNRKKAIYITDADIDRVKDELINGHNHLTIANFDNLINAGDTGIDAIPDQDTLAVLRDIALATRLQAYCYRSAITCSATIAVETVLDDLVRREVVEKQGPSLYRIRVELFKEWLLAHQ